MTEEQVPNKLGRKEGRLSRESGGRGRCGGRLKPLDLGHSYRHTFSERVDLTLEVDKEGVRMPPVNYIDGMFGDAF